MKKIYKIFNKRDAFRNLSLLIYKEAPFQKASRLSYVYYSFMLPSNSMIYRNTLVINEDTMIFPRKFNDRYSLEAYGVPTGGDIVVWFAGVR